MARYETEYQGIPAAFAEARGLDPNYRDGYWGMRMTGGGGRAAYGMLRARLSQDLETAGGFGGIHGHSDRAQIRSRYGREESGGVRDPFRDLDFIRDFNARSPMYDGDRRSGERYPAGPRDQIAHERSWSPNRTEDGHYGDRSISEGGYGEVWARGPMRGAR
jgi:hypothetical protein